VHSQSSVHPATYKICDKLLHFETRADQRRVDGVESRGRIWTFCPSPLKIKEGVGEMFGWMNHVRSRTLEIGKMHSTEIKGLAFGGSKMKLALKLTTLAMRRDGIRWWWWWSPRRHYNRQRTAADKDGIPGMHAKGIWRQKCGHRASGRGTALAGKTLPPNSLPPNMAATNLRRSEVPHHCWDCRAVIVCEMVPKSFDNIKDTEPSAIAISCFTTIRLIR